MRTAKVEINYLDFVESRYISNELKTLTKEKWVKLDKSEVVSSHPPAEAILLTPGTKTIVATPFKIPDPTDEPNKRLIEQNNYTNQSLVVVGRQLDKIETKIDKLLPSTPKLKSHLTDESRNSIIHAVKLNEDGLPLFDVNIGRGIEDGVNTLLYTIVEHFVGTPSHTQARIHDQLSNLRCPQLSDFRWYKDVFISRVMLREDSNQAFWKEKFINGLPNLFAHKIRTVLSNELGHIDYDNLTYGNIISTINQEGMKMCIDMKINKQIQSERKSAKYELGNFCEQYGLISTVPSRKNKSSYPSHIRKKRHYSKQRKPYRHFDEPNEFYRKSKYSPRKRWSKAPRYKKDTRFSKRTDKGKSKDKSKVKCFKCQKYGHYANDCKVKDAIRQLKITDEEKDNLIKVLELRNSESSENETMVSSPESVNYESSDSQMSSPKIQLGCRDKCCNTLKQISVLTKQEEQEELLIDLISKIENPDLKSEYLRKLRKIITQDTGTSHPSPVINLSSTLERFNKKKEVSLHDLHSEVKLVKKEIVELKQLSHKLQTENYDIRQVLNALLEKEPSESNSPPGSPVHKSDKDEQSVNLIKQVNFRKWYSKFTIIVKNFELNTVALFDSGADLNCIKEGLIPTQYYKKSTESLSTASGKSLQLNYEIPKAHVCQNKVCFKTSFVLIKNITDEIAEHDRYKTAFVTPFGHYEWNPLFDRLQSNPPPWSSVHTEIVKQIKSHVKTLPCLGIPTTDSFKIVETDASDIGYGGILKQKSESTPSEQIVRFHSGIWTQSQFNYTMAKDKQKMSQERFPPLPRILPATLSQKPVKNEPSSSSVKHEPFTLTPYPGHPPIPVMSNRFSPLGSTVAPTRPNYQSALVSSYDPFQLPPTATPMSSQFFPKSSPYVLKNTANLFILEPHIHKSMSPAQIAEHHFPTNFHYLPHSPYKSLKFYREILHETKSVEIKPIRDKTDPTKIIYHSLYIHKVLSQKDWGLRPHELRTLPSKYQYNYADYVESWYYIFLHQTPEFSHSWFINFDVKFRNDLPYWFLHWWDTHGPKSDILPPQVNELIVYWTQKTKFAERDLWFSRDLLFITKYRIPWIMRWNYAANWETRFFSRQFFVKWWDRFEVHRITEYVYRDLPPTPKPAPPQKHETSSAHSSETTLTVDGKSKTELQELAQQILLRASQMQDDKDADTESQSSSSCQPGQQTPEHECPMRWSDYPHGQDLNEDYAEAYKAYDLNSD
ncbi:unnamed protein product [Prunus brigantina]